MRDWLNGVYGVGKTCKGKLKLWNNTPSPSLYIGPVKAIKRHECFKMSVVFGEKHRSLPLSLDNTANFMTLKMHEGFEAGGNVQ